MTPIYNIPLPPAGSDEAVRARAFAETAASEAGVRLESLTRLPGAGSTRSYYRLGLSDGRSAILTVGHDLRENLSFLRLTRCFLEAGLPVPRLLAVSTPEPEMYIQEDLGPDNLLSLLGTPEGERLAVETLQLLPRFQTLPERVWEVAVFSPPFVGSEIINDLHYFKFCFLKTSGVEFDEQALEVDFRSLAAAIDAVPTSCRGLMLRDFQSRNIMVVSGGEEELRPVFIDYQGARRGPLAYDAVSFLWQAKAGFAPERRRELLEEYAGALCRLRPEVSVKDLLGSVPELALLRTLQVLGAYGFRGLVEQKAHFISSIPAAIDNFRELLADARSAGCPSGWREPTAERWPELCRVAEALGKLERFRRQPAPVKGLTVTVTSFSFRKGYPLDMSGNGGGFVFDCRALPNPGRYEEYKTLTGRDLPVIEFLEREREVDRFVENAERLVFPSVKRYLERGFTSLQIACGCTGGRHRSVYTAERIARGIKEAYPEARVVVVHSEHSIVFEI